MNVKNIDKIDVCERFFHIDGGPILKFADKLNTDGNISMNEVILKEDAARFISQEKCANRNSLSRLSISQVPLRVDMVKDFRNEKIFANENAIYCGWLLQYDPTPFANWYHDCFYFFVVGNDTYQEIRYNRGLSDAIKMQIL